MIINALKIFLLTLNFFVCVAVGSPFQDRSYHREEQDDWIVKTPFVKEREAHIDLTKIGMKPFLTHKDVAALKGAYSMVPCTFVGVGITHRYFWSQPEHFSLCKIVVRNDKFLTPFSIDGYFAFEPQFTPFRKEISCKGAGYYSYCEYEKAKNINLPQLRGMDESLVLIMSQNVYVRTEGVSGYGFYPCPSKGGDCVFFRLHENHLLRVTSGKDNEYLTIGGYGVHCFGWLLRSLGEKREDYLENLVCSPEKEEDAIKKAKRLYPYWASELGFFYHQVCGASEMCGKDLRSFLNHFHKIEWGVKK